MEPGIMKIARCKGTRSLKQIGVALKKPITATILMAGISMTITCG
jgi:hypothetical protein